MFAARGGGSRFTLLLLEEGEDYVLDYQATCSWPREVPGPRAQGRDVKGTLRLCSKSLFFEPTNKTIPIVRLPFNETRNVTEGSGLVFAMEVGAVTLMKINNEDRPYNSHQVDSRWQFELLFSTMDRLMQELKRYLQVSQEHRGRLAERDDLLKEMAAERETRARFDYSRLVEGVRETVVLECAAKQVGPLVKESGRLVVTSLRLYFQPLHDIRGNQPVRSHPLKAIAAIARRKSSLLPLGIEVFFVSPELVTGMVWDAPSAFFVLHSQQEREAVLNAIKSCPDLGSEVAAAPGLSGTFAHQTCMMLEAGGQWLRRVMRAWQMGKISNMDYLLYLNQAAGRSFNDLAQWPVFPWVLADYTSQRLDLSNPASFRDLSRPMGALGAPSRLQQARRRYHDLVEMELDGGCEQLPFMWGTHYSAPGFVMYWLVRAAPAHLLRLQGGRFDKPDRLFTSIPAAWRSVTGDNMADVKELVPELYMPAADFLVNWRNLHLGRMQSGQLVGDVELPAWASSPQDFLYQHRLALESEHVQQNLHRWIDLIFGYKQKGSCAIEADNLFTHLSYEGAVDVASIQDPVLRKAMEVQINEYGQTPVQLFEHPHPPRHCVAPPPAAELRLQYCAADAGAAAQADAEAASVSGLAARSDRAGQAMALALISTIAAAAGTTDAEVDAAAAAAAAPPPPPPAARNSSDSSGAAGGGGDGGGGGSSSGSREELTDAVGELPGSQGKAITGQRLSMFVQGIRQRLSPTLSALSQRRPGSASDAPAADLPSTDPQTVLAHRSVSQPLASSFIPPPAAEGGLSPASLPFRDVASEPIAPPPDPPEASAWADAEAPQAPAPAGANGGGGGGGAAHWWWGHGLRDRLQLAWSCQPQREALQDVAVSGALGGIVCTCADSAVKVATLQDGSTIRAHKIPDGSLSTLAVLDPGGCSGIGGPPALALVAGFQDVHAYCIEYGTMQGRSRVQNDLVSCMQLCSGDGSGCPSTLATASHDCSVRLWSLDEGRQPWSCSSSAVPLLELDSHDAAVWSLHVDDSLRLVAVGYEDGTVAVWDLRDRNVVWEAPVASDYVSGVALCPRLDTLVVSSGDGSLALLEMRQGGQIKLAEMKHDAPLGRCFTDGCTAIAASDTGQVLLWDAGHGLQPSSGDWTPPGPEGLYPPMATNSESPILGLSVAFVEGGQTWTCSTCHEDGTLQLYKAVAI